MCTNIEESLSQELLCKLEDKRNYVALLNDTDVRSELDSLVDNYDIRDIDQLYDLPLSDNLLSLLELYFLDRSKRNKRHSYKGDSFGLYIRSIAKYPVLTREEEVELFTKYSECSDPAQKEELKEKIIKSNLRLVVSIAKDYLHRGFTFLELISEGNIGLIVSIDRFDYTKGYKFSTYADFWIRQAITSSLANDARIIRLPVHLQQNVTKVKYYLNNYYECNGREMTLDEDNIKKIAQELSLSVYAVRVAINYKEVTSLDQMIFMEDSDKPFSDAVPSSDVNPEDEIFYGKQLEEIAVIVDKCLTDKEKRVLYYRYGFYDGEPKTLKEISVIMNVTGEYIRQLEIKAIKKIRAQLTIQDMKFKSRINRGL